MDSHQSTKTAPVLSPTASTSSVKSSVPITISVRTMDGASHDFVVAPSDKVRQLKDLITQSPIAPSVATPLAGPSSSPAAGKQRLIFATREMQDDDEVGSYGVVDGSRVSLTLNLAIGETAIRSPLSAVAPVLPSIADAMDIDVPAPAAAVAQPVVKPAAVAAPRPGGGKKRRCDGLLGVPCRNLAQRLTGECDDCAGKYCSSHRLPEDHKCPSLSKRNADAHAENAKRLVANKLDNNKLLDRTRS